MWWKFNFGPTVKRCADPACYPKPRDLTRSEFQIAVYDIEDQLRCASDVSDVESTIEDIQALGQEQEEKWENLPDQLKYGSTGELLEERRDNCEQWATEIEMEKDAYEAEIEHHEDEENGPDLSEESQMWGAFKERITELCPC